MMLAYIGVRPTNDMTYSIKPIKDIIEEEKQKAKIKMIARTLDAMAQISANVISVSIETYMFVRLYSNSPRPLTLRVTPTSFQSLSTRFLRYLRFSFIDR